MMAEIKKQKKIVIFTSPSCKWCKVAKDYFKQKGYKFKTIDISKDKDAQYDCLAHGCRGVPVVLIGSRWICGFDKKSIEKALK
jgi:glutaredoxin